MRLASYFDQKKVFQRCNCYLYAPWPCNRKVFHIVLLEFVRTLYRLRSNCILYIVHCTLYMPLPALSPLHTGNRRCMWTTCDFLRHQTREKAFVNQLPTRMHNFCTSPHPRPFYKISCFFYANLYRRHHPQYFFNICIDLDFWGVRGALCKYLLGILIHWAVSDSFLVIIHSIFTLQSQESLFHIE